MFLLVPAYPGSPGQRFVELLLLLLLYRLLGILLARVIDISSTVTQEGCPIELLCQLFIFYLSSRSALQKCCTAYVISEWAAAMKVFCCIYPPVLHCVSKKLCHFMIFQITQ